jgi:signal transduction histidine kinase
MILIAYGLSLVLVNVVALLWLFIRSPQHRWPAALMLFGQLAGRAIYLFATVPSLILAWPDPVIVSIVLPYTMYAIALFGFRIFDPLPTARRTAVEQTREGMVVLDARERVASLNPAAASMLSISAVHARGRTLHELLPAFPDLCARLTDAGNPIAASGLQEKTPNVTDISLGTGPEARCYALDVSFLKDFRGLTIGRLLLLFDVTEQRRAQAQALEQQRTLAVIRERERLARELHDNLAQVLAFVNAQGQAVRRLLARGEIAAADEHVGRLVEVAREADTDIRESILGLRVALTEQGLSRALATYLDQYEQRYGIHTELRRPEMLGDGAVEPLVEVQLLRIIQEALTNARKHSRARSVCVTFAAQDGCAQVTVQDDGCGFDPGEAFGDSAGRVGLRVMRERAEEIGGTLAVQSAPGEGTQVIVTAPLARGRGDGETR